MDDAVLDRSRIDSTARYLLSTLSLIGVFWDRVVEIWLAQEKIGYR
jgi:hypothetical protein